MKTILAYLIASGLALIVIEENVSAAPKFGIGFILGDPSGITGKAFLGDNDAVDFGVGQSARDGFYLYGDYLRHFNNVFPVSGLALYFGAGAGLHNHDRNDNSKNNDDDEDETSLEARLPIGLEYTVRTVPLGLFIELAPVLEVIPDFDFHLRGGIGVRYYF